MERKQPNDNLFLKNLIKLTKGKIIALFILILIFFSLKIIITLCTKYSGNSAFDICHGLGFIIMLPALVIYATPLEFLMDNNLYIKYVSEIVIIMIYYTMVAIILTRIKTKKKE